MVRQRPRAVLRWAAGAALAVAGASAALAEGEPRYADGAATFQANCAVCHRASGAGTPGLAPPVTQYPPRFIAIPEGRRQLVEEVARRHALAIDTHALLEGRGALLARIASGTNSGELSVTPISELRPADGEG